MGRVPALLNEWLNAIQARNTPTVCVVVYGNRVYDDALLELKNTVMKCGCIPIACAAYIGEHSFSNSETQQQRTSDKDDYITQKHLDRKYVKNCNPFHQSLRFLMCMCLALILMEELQNCGLLILSQSVMSVPSAGPVQRFVPLVLLMRKIPLIDIEKCITCCACIKNCPQSARTMKPGLVKDASVRLHTLYSQRKEPEFFI